MTQAMVDAKAAPRPQSIAGSGGIYLDYNATTPVDPRVVEVVIEFMGPRFGNAASTHRMGRAAEVAIDRSAQQVATLLGCDPGDVVWTSGATEAINTAIKGLAWAADSPRRKIVVSAAEHKAVLDAAWWLADDLAFEVVVAQVDETGVIDIDRLTQMVDEKTLFVAAMAANNETGVLNPIAQIADVAHRNGALYLCDATQQAAKLPIDIAEADIDIAFISSHKMYGPQGVGALAARSEVRRRLTPLIHGGGHQGGLRAGTLNLPGIVGFGLAADLALDEVDNDGPARIESLRDRLEQNLADRVPDLTFHGRSRTRLPNTSSVRIAGVDGDAMVVGLTEVQIATGSACTSAVPTPSHVLTAMGLDEAEASQTLRLSIGRFSQQEELNHAVEQIAKGADRIRALDS